MSKHDQKEWITVAGLALLAALYAPATLAGGEHGGGHGDQSDGHMQESAGHGDGHGSAGGHGDGSGHSFDFGAAAPDAEPDRTIEIVARDTMRFEPDSVTVKPGETVRFVVRNVGSLQHSFTLGSPQYQQQHEQEMQGMALEMMAGHMDDSDNGIVVQPGQTDSLTWKFEKDGPVEFACHIPGHYPAGMKGGIRIN